MSWLLVRLAEQALFPPFILIVVAALGLWLSRRRRRLGGALIGLSLLALYGAAMPLTGRLLVGALEVYPALEPPYPEAEAIVILGAGAQADAPEYEEDSLGGSALVRLRYGAHLQRLTGVPILVAGGNPTGATRPEAAIMKDVLEQEFGVPVRWAESQSNNTRESAIGAYTLLVPEGIARIYLVTHAIHMARSVEAFERAGFAVVPAPTHLSGEIRPGPLDLLPSGDGLATTNQALHEWVGRLWYWLRG